MVQHASSRELNLAKNDENKIVGWRDIGYKQPHTIAQTDWLILFEEHVNIFLSSPNITSEDWRAVYDALQNPKCALRYFLYTRKDVCDEDATNLANS